MAGSIGNSFLAEWPGDRILFDGTTFYNANGANTLDFHDDFMWDPGNAANVFWKRNQSGTGASVGKASSIPQTAIAVNTGSATTGSAVIWTSQGQGQLGEGIIAHDWIVSIPTLSTASEAFTVNFGMGSTWSDLGTSKGVYFEYLDAGGAAPEGNWSCVTEASGTRTVTDSSVAVVGGQFDWLRFEINAAASSVEFFINGTSVATNTTNIPTSVDLAMGWGGIQKSAGTTTRSAYIDYMRMWQKFTSARHG